MLKQVNENDRYRLYTQRVEDKIFNLNYSMNSEPNALSPKYLNSLYVKAAMSFFKMVRKEQKASPIVAVQSLSCILQVSKLFSRI